MMTAVTTKQTDKCERREACITPDTSVLQGRMWLHIKLLYTVFILLAAACALSVWLCLQQVSKLRADFEGQIVPRGMAEFGVPPHGYYGNAWDLNESDDDGEFEDDDNVTSYSSEPIATPLGDGVTPTGDHVIKGGYEVVDSQETGEDGLIRVKRRAPRQPRRSRKKKRDKSRNDPMYFTGDTPPYHQDGSEGSGAGSMDDWVWINGYSRIPVMALTQFCRASHDYCPPGREGPPGLPGPTGVKGDPGYKGDKGAIGYMGEKGESGEPGSKGDRGDDGLPGLNGQKGEPGETNEGTRGPAGPPGLPGAKGEAGYDGFPGQPGEPGINGTTGRRGKRGRLGDSGPPGEPGPPGPEGPRGHKGPKGDTGEAGLDADSTNCTCPPGPYATGPPGPAGLPGQIGPKGQKGDPGSDYVMTTEPTTPQTTTVEPTIDPRNSECRIRMVGKPLFQRYTGTYWGAWMKDTYRKTSPDVNKFWFTRHFTGKSLYEYANQDEFRANRETKVYDLEDLYFGTGHTVYDGAFFYHKSGTRDLIKFDLTEGSVVGSLEMPKAAYQGKHYVYNTEYNYFDLASDENGLWVIYSADGEDLNMLVSKINPYAMEIEKTWNISVSHASYGNGFITCGVLYLIKNTHAKTTLIDFAYDLYTKEQVNNVRLQFTNPFQMNNMISYNPLEGRIYSWDKGNQLTYPLLL